MIRAQEHTIKYRWKHTQDALRKHLTSDHIRTRGHSMFPFAKNDVLLRCKTARHPLFYLDYCMLSYELFYASLLNTHNAFGEFFILVPFYHSISKSALGQTNNVARNCVSYIIIQKTVQNAEK